MQTQDVKYTINRAYQYEKEQQDKLDRGLINEEEWFRNHIEWYETHYLQADSPRSQSGHSGGETIYRFTRGMLLEAIHKNGSFLDVGCANGHLIEMVSQWTKSTEIELTVYGLDFSRGLLDLAQHRLPLWSHRFFYGNALEWKPARKFDFVCIAELGYVPRGREQDLFENLYSNYVASDGRLIVGPVGEEREKPRMAKKLESWGYTCSGYCEKSHHSHPSLCKRLFWFDR